MIRKLLLAALLVGAAPAQADTLLLKPARVFDGAEPERTVRVGTGEHDADGAFAIRRRK